MAGLTGHRALTDGLFQHFMQAERAIKQDVQFAAHEAGNAGRLMASHIIDTKESSLRPGKMNRNWTHEMNNSLAYDVKTNGNTTTIRMGWIRTKEAYFLIQEDGGTVNGIDVTPMHALMWGHEEMLATLARWGIKTT